MQDIIFVVGARPNFMKVAPIIRAIKKTTTFSYKLVHTGQHYDFNMSDVFFRDLDIPCPEYFLDVGSASHAQQTAKAIIAIEKVLIKHPSRLVIVVGDVNSTLAAALAAKKIGIKVAHVEAGLRSFDMTMPEEINRIVTDSISDYFFITEESARKNLINEGKDCKSIYFVGNVMIDSLSYALDKIKFYDRRDSLAALKEKLGKYIYLTIHRPSNVDDKDRFRQLIKVLTKISEITPIIFPMHPRTKRNLQEFGMSLVPSIHVLEPVSYNQSIFLCKDALAVITDSGGLQEETTALDRPCFTLRNNTERLSTIELGTNLLVKDQGISGLPDLIVNLSKGNAKKGVIPPAWDGDAALRIVQILIGLLK